MSILTYPSDLSDAEWKILAPYFATKKTYRPRIHDVRHLINAIRYVMKTGCQWRMLPHDFPKWKTVHDHYRKWIYNGIIQKIHDLLVQKVRIAAGKEPNPTVGIIDSQSIKTTGKGDERGYDAGKKNQGSQKAYNCG